MTISPAAAAANSFAVAAIVVIVCVVPVLVVVLISVVVPVYTHIPQLATGCASLAVFRTHFSLGILRAALAIARLPFGPLCPLCLLCLFI